MLRVSAFVQRDGNPLEEAADTLREALRFEKQLGHRFPTLERVSQDYIDVLVRMKQFDEAVDCPQGRLKLAAADDPPDRALVERRTARLDALRRLAVRHASGPTTEPTK